MNKEKELLEEEYLEKLEKKFRKQFAKKYRKMFLGLLAGFAVLLLIIIILFSTVLNQNKKIKELKDTPIVVNPITTEISLDTIQSKMSNIGELVSQEFYYTNAGKFSDPKEIGNITLPFAFTTKSFIAKWDGSIKAGIDLVDVIITTDETAKKIIVKMPKATILSHEIDSESFEALDEKNGLFNPIKVADYKKFETTCKIEMEERAIGNGILEKATENAQGILRNLINTDPVAQQEYNIVFEIIE